MGYRYLNTGTAVPVFAAEPPVATEGSLYYNSTSDIFYICNGTRWNLVSNASPTTTGGTRTIDALSEGGTFSYDLGDDFTDDVDTDGELTYTLASGTLPVGCTLPTTGNSAFTGTASGVSSNTNYTWTIKVTDTSGATATQDYQQTINTVAPTSTGGTVTISNTSEGASASYDVDTNFSYPTGSTFSAYSLQSGSLPNGLSLNTTSGVISGTAGNSGSASFTIRATDTDGDVKDQAYSWVINNVVPTSTGGTVTISAVNEGSSASYDVDTNFTFTTGSTFSAYSLLSGSLPSGLSFNTSTGVISGTMGTVSSDTAYSFTIRGTDTDGDTADQAYSWTITNVPFSATGGTITTYSGYRVHTFTSSASGASGFVPNKSGSVDYLVVAGGGGGGMGEGGGGGGGGVITGSASVVASNYTVVIGSGGVKGYASSGTIQNVAGNGTNSSFDSYAATGGGGGGASMSTGYRDGQAGGSGGGGAYVSGAGAGGSGTVSQGSAGGTPSLTTIGAGGGGAGAVGSNTGNGGNGIQSSISNTSYYYGGGGGGASHSGGGSGGMGGGAGGKQSGAGGAGGTTVPATSPIGNNASASPGGVNTGGGGGAGHRFNGHVDNGGAGGSGIVIIRYAI